MKKFITLAVAAFMVLSLTGCASGQASENATPSDSTSSSDNVKPADNSSKQDEKPADTPDSKPESKPETTPESKPESKPTEPEKSVSPEDIEVMIAKALSDGYLCTVDVPADELYTSAISWLDLEQVESYVAKRGASFGQDSVAIAQCKAGYADDAVKIFNEYYAQTISYIRQYPFDVAKVEGARIYKVGDIVMFFITGASAEVGTSVEDEAKLAVSEYAKLDEAIKSIFGFLPENLAVITEPEIPDNGGEFDGGFVFEDEDFGDMPMIGG